MRGDQMRDYRKAGLSEREIIGMQSNTHKKAVHRGVIEMRDQYIAESLDYFNDNSQDR